MRKKKKIVVAVSGGFDPVHIGHIDLFRKAKALGDELVVLLNNDNWLISKKGFYFMNQKDRKAILEAIQYVDRVRISGHKPRTRDWSSNDGIRAIKPDIFAQGGDRKHKNTAETDTCKEFGVKMVYGVGKKIRSSTAYLKEYVQKSKKARRSKSTYFQ
ncbi:MAG: adenylyltransferase/cytidyltransferase family protein [Parcubacteria group bacterium]